jgi:PAS domain S-box-containing protein
MSSEKIGSDYDHRGVLDAFGKAILLVEPADLRVIDANVHASELIGTSLCDMLTKGSVIDIISSSPIGAIEGLAEVLRIGEGSIMCSVPNGQTGSRPMVMDVRPFFEGDRKRTMLLFRNIGRGERALRDLEHIKTEQAALMDMITDLVFSIDRSGRIVFVNKAVRGLGYREEEVIGDKISSFIAPSSRDTVSKLLRSVFFSEKLEKAYSIEILAKDGEAHLLKVRGRLIQDGKMPVQVQCIARDITPMVEVDKALGESLWQYKSLFENAHVGHRRIRRDRGG